MNEMVQYEDVRKENVNLSVHAHELAKSVKDEASFQMATEFMRRIKERRRWWAEKIKPAVKSAHEAHQRIKALEKEIDQPLDQAENMILKPAIASYEVKQELLRRQEQQRIADEEARRREDEKLNLAVELEKAGDEAEAEEVLDQPVARISVELPKAAQAEGVSYRWNYGARVTDFGVLLKAVAEGRAPRSCVMPNQTFLNAKARADKDEFGIPGVELVKDRSVNVRV